MVRRKKYRSRKRGGWLLPVLGICLVLSGAAVLFYPRLTDWMYRSEADDEYRRFTEWSGDRDKAEQLELLYRELVRQNEALYRTGQSGLVDPFSYEQPEVDLSSYGLEDDIIGFISIEKMDIRLPILLGANEENMKKGAVHLTNTSYPVGGENTNCVLAAHRGYSRTAMFRDIELLKPGNEVVIENFRERLTYRVEAVKVIDPDEIDEVLIQEGKDMMTLITCHPYGQNRQRYVVYCIRDQIP